MASVAGSDASRGSVGALARDLPAYARAPPVEAVVFAWGEIAMAWAACSGGGVAGSVAGRAAEHDQVRHRHGKKHTRSLLQCDSAIKRTRLFRTPSDGDIGRKRNTRVVRNYHQPTNQLPTN